MDLTEVTVVKPHVTPSQLMVVVQIARDMDRLVTFASILNWMNTLILNYALFLIVQGLEMGDAMLTSRYITLKLAIGTAATAVREHATSSMLILIAGIRPTLMIAKTLLGLRALQA